MLRALLLTAFLLVAALAGLITYEVQTARFEAEHIAQYAASLKYLPGKGASPAIRFPAFGPFDQRMGYTKLPQIAERLQSRGFALTHQARFSDPLMEYAAHGLFVPYREKTRAGLDLADCRGERLYRFRYPYRGYDDFAAIPAVVAQALMFIENRDLLDETRPMMNPAVDWVRFTRAVIGRLGRMVSEDLDAPGGSTLATQIEKYRHSPDGVTANAREKLRQMVSASVRAYQDGEQTLPARRRILLDYLNTVPLSAAPGYGEVNGLGDGLWVWFGADFKEVNSLLAAPAAADRLAQQGGALLQVVALMIAHRRPSYYLSRAGRGELEKLTRSYTRLLGDHGLTSPALRDAALAAPLKFRDLEADPAVLPTDLGKGTTTIRSRAAGLFDASLYELDRFDVDVSTTLHSRLQQSVSDFLGQLTEVDFARSQGLLGDRLLDPKSLDAVRYSFTLVERTPAGNRVRVQTDTTDQPLDINEGSKLELGSTAKLRVLATYLEIIAELHQRHAETDPAELRKLRAGKHDPLTAWALDYLINASKDRSLTAMLQAALQRSYSANPGENFFTGGGLHTFNNFRKEDNGRAPTVREALQGSINLPFVRLMRDIVRYAMYQVPGSSAQLLKDADDPRRQEYLARFADREGQVFLRRFWNKYHGKKPEELRDAFLDGLRPGTERLVAIFRYLSPRGTPEELAAFLRQRIERDDLSGDRLAKLYARYAPEAYDLPDRGFIARVHPLELWLVGFLYAKPDAGWSEAVQASARERQEVYRWLFRTRFKDAQDSRIHTMLEVEAFLDIHRRWARLGYPFGHLVPSLATALGSSGDRPAALADLMGIIVNDGIRLPTQRIDRLAFASGTPYETRFAQAQARGERVMAPEVAATLRNALSEVVEGGTARRLAGAFKLAGQPLALGGKTGTGDNRIVVSNGGGKGVALNRTATFVFYLGDKHFGTLTAYVIGPEAGSYRFTSALPVQILKSMGPALLPSLEPDAGRRCGA